MLEHFECKSCGAPIDFVGENRVVCAYCGAVFYAKQRPVAELSRDDLSTVYGKPLGIEINQLPEMGVSVLSRFTIPGEGSWTLSQMDKNESLVVKRIQALDNSYRTSLQFLELLCRETQTSLKVTTNLLFSQNQKRKPIEAQRPMVYSKVCKMCEELNLEMTAQYMNYSNSDEMYQNAFATRRISPVSECVNDIKEKTDEIKRVLLSNPDIQVLEEKIVEVFQNRINEYIKGSIRPEKGLCLTVNSSGITIRTFLSVQNEITQSDRFERFFDFHDYCTEYLPNESVYFSCLAADICSRIIKRTRLEEHDQWGVSYVCGDQLVKEPNSYVGTDQSKIAREFDVENRRLQVVLCPMINNKPIYKEWR